MIPVPPASPLDPDLYPAGKQIESAGTAVSWPAVLAGSAAAIATWLTLFTLGAGLGLAQAAHSRSRSRR